MARRELVEIDRADVNWAAARSEYVAGGVSMAALARKHGVSDYAVRKRAASEGWMAAKAAGGVKEGDGAGADGTEVAGGAGSGADGVNAGAEASEAVDANPAPEAGTGREVEVARRTRMALLQMLERAAAAIPCDATEVKTTGNGGEVKLLKLRDLTAAYKELSGDLPAEDADGGSRVVIDV
jgi:transposase-like protein